MRVKGTYALLTHNPMSMFIANDNNGKAKKGARTIPTAEAEAEAGLYHLEDGGFGLPGFAFRNSILATSSRWKMPKSRTSLIYDLASLMVIEDLVPLINDDGSRITSYEIHTMRAVVQGNGIPRSRPKFRHWGAEFTLEYDEELGVTPELIRDIASDAGKRTGVGDYRPQKVKGLPGPFGRYAVVSCEPIALFLEAAQ
jgi:hypothetical protein